MGGGGGWIQRGGGGGGGAGGLGGMPNQMRGQRGGRMNTRTMNNPVSERRRRRSRKRGWNNNLSLCLSRLFAELPPDEPEHEAACARQADQVRERLRL